MTISPVTETLRLSLPSILGEERPGVPFSITKPRILPPSAWDFAQTMNTSAIGEFEIHVLVPMSLYPKAVFSARVVMADGSEPASASVRPKQPISCPLASLGR